MQADTSQSSCANPEPQLQDHPDIVYQLENLQLPPISNLLDYSSDELGELNAVPNQAVPSNLALSEADREEYLLWHNRLRREQRASNMAEMVAQ